MQVGVLIPVYNNQRGLERTIHSLRGEPLLTIVVVDDGSNPPIFIDEIATDHKIKYIRVPANVGIESALNVGLRWCIENGFKFVARIDAGDRWVAGRLQRQVQFLERNNDHLLVGGQAVFTDASGAFLLRTELPTQFEDIKRVANYRCPFIHPAVMFRTSALEKVGYYSTKYKAAEDYDMWMRFMRVGKCANLDDIVVLCEVNERGISVRRRRVQKWSSIVISLHYANWSNIHWYIGIGIKFLMLLLSHKYAVRIHRFLASKKKLWNC